MKNPTSKLIIVASAALVMCALTAGHSSAQTFLVNLSPSGAGNDFIGSPTIFKNGAGAALPLATLVANPPLSGSTYTLGTSSLTLNGSSYSFGGTSTSQTAVTHSFYYASGGNNDTFSLTGLLAGDTVDFQFLATPQPFLADVAVAGGATAPSSGSLLIPAAADNLTPMFTDYGSLTGFTQYSGVFSQSNGGEADISAILVTITPPVISIPPTTTPEPSTYVMMGMGLTVLAVLARRRSLRA